MRINRRVSKKELADFKRLTELCTANPQWREEFLAQPEKWLAEQGLCLEAELAVNAMTYSAASEEDLENPYLLGIQEMIRKIHQEIRKKVCPQEMPDLAFRQWYLRKSRGYLFTSAISRQMSPGFYYIPFAFELSDGCSVGCPFCCFAAERLNSVSRYTEENAALWKEILKISSAMAGSMTGMGICYMATEPFDNPDYEYFLKDYREILGRFPQTTTAVGHKNPARMKKFLKMMGEENLSKAALRFSITSLEQLRRIHESYSPEELLYIELLMNNLESVNAYAKAGRAMALSDTLMGKHFQDNISTACCCGFLVNLPRKTAALVSPHLPDRRHPKGMRIYEERSFTDAKEYGRVLQEMKEKWMPEELPENMPFNLADGVRLRQKGYIYSFQGERRSRKFSFSKKEQWCLMRLLKEEITLQELYRSEELKEFEILQLKSKICILYENGCLEEDIIQRHSYENCHGSSADPL